MVNRKGLAPLLIGIIIFIVAVGTATMYFSVSSPKANAQFSPGINDLNCVKADLVGGSGLTPSGSVTNTDVLWVKSKIGCNTTSDIDCARADIVGGVNGTSNGQVSNSEVLYVKSMIGCSLQAPTCYDSEKKDSLWNWGTVYGVTYNNTTNLSVGYKYTDYCVNSNTVMEYACNSSGQSLASQTSCPSGYSCSNGACVVNQITNSCNDSDGGIFPFINGTVNLTVENASGYSVDYCITSTDLFEYYCDGGNNLMKVQLNCTMFGSNYKCQNGVCVINQNGTVNQCNDSDGGFKPNTFGNIIGYTNNVSYSYSDYCINNSTLNERYCNGVQPTNSTYNCLINSTTACQNGKCIYIVDIIEGQNKTVIVDGKIYNVSLGFVSSTAAKIIVNGEVTSSLHEGETYRLSEGTYISVIRINFNSKDTGVSDVEISISNS
ncbi:MAG: hypothetical protein Q7S74_02405 [Nanoarchaeota archaeon]|nr:hypothetical protein [Nanoarchaeota archaeon]